jgi:hypothetical protein
LSEPDEGDAEVDQSRAATSQRDLMLDRMHGRVPIDDRVSLWLEKSLD